MIALDLDQLQFAILGKEPQYHDGSVSVGILSLDRGRMERLKRTLFDALRVRLIRPTMRGYFLLSFRDIKDSTNGCSSHTCHQSPHIKPSLSFGGPPYHGCLEEIMPVKRYRRSGFTGQRFVTTGSISMKHCRNGVGVSISRCIHFNKNTRNFT